VSDRLPILRIGENLLVSIQADLDDQTVMNLQEDLAEQVV
jgi:rsbT antagonist protein RsbS